MMKKLIPLAVAAAMAAPAAALADATIYGKLHVSIDYVDLDDYVTWPGYLPAGHTGADVVGAATGYTDALAFGTFADDGTVITDPVASWATTATDTYDAKIAAGWSDDAAMYAAIKDANAAGSGRTGQHRIMNRQAPFKPGG